MAQLLNLELPYVKVIGSLPAICMRCHMATANICIEEDEGGLRCMFCWSEEETKDASQYDWFAPAIERSFFEALRPFI